MGVIWPQRTSKHANIEIYEKHTSNDKVQIQGNEHVQGQEVDQEIIKLYRKLEKLEKIKFNLEVAQILEDSRTRPHQALHSELNNM